MRDWSLRCSNPSQPADPLALTLAADFRLCQPDYLNDHIWELDPGAGEPPSVSIHTTYGLRARSMRLFYRFAEGGKALVNPDEFHSPPRLRRFYPNFMELSFVPLEGLELTAEYWAPESHVLAGRLTFTNRATTAREVEFALCGVMTPLDGKALAPAQHQMINVLSGRTGGLTPVVFMAGGAQRGTAAHPSLSLKLAFGAGMTRTLAWACAAEGDAQASFDLARRTVARPWDAERSRIELLDTADVLDIYTGDPDWDAAFAFSQRSALALFYPASEHLPRPSFVRTRHPDGGYSHTGNGLDYPPDWSGQSAFDTYYLASLLPVAHELKQGLLENFLSVQTADGAIDARPGLGGQRAKYAAAPLLASLAWSDFMDVPDEAFLAEAFPKLLAFFDAWFASERDPDGDGIPQWQQVLQTGFDDHPLLDTWHPWSQGVSGSAVFNPELEALLCREADSLIAMARELGRVEALNALQRHAAALEASVAAAWTSRSLYGYRDRLTGASQPGRLIGSQKGSGELSLKIPEFDQPVRLLVQVETKSPGLQHLVIEITGLSAVQPPAVPAADGSEAARTDLPQRDRNQIERMETPQFQWRAGGLVATSQNVYGRINRIMVKGLDEQDRLVVQTVDTSGEDITLFTPLWAHLPDQEQAEGMLRRTLLASGIFDQRFGIPALPTSPAGARAGAKETAEAEAVAFGVHLPWNQLIGEGLLAYGFRAEAARLTTRLMSAVVQSLKQNRCFYERYHSRTGSGLGERGALTGLAPLGLFLQTLGVHIISPTSVRLAGRNPYPWPVTLVYRGLRVVRGPDATQVVFHNGQVVTVSDPAPCLVSM